MKTTSFKQDVKKHLLARQKKTADYLNSKAKSWTKAGKILFLCAVCTFFIAGIAMNMPLHYPIEKHVLPAIRTPPALDSIPPEHFLLPKK